MTSTSQGIFTLQVLICPPRPSSSAWEPRLAPTQALDTLERMGSRASALPAAFTVSQPLCLYFPSAKRVRCRGLLPSLAFAVGPAWTPSLPTVSRPSASLGGSGPGREGNRPHLPFSSALGPGPCPQCECPDYWQSLVSLWKWGPPCQLHPQQLRNC